MSFVLSVLPDKPLALYMLDDTTPLQDHSGYNRVATTTGTINKYASLVRGAAYASTFTSTAIGTFESPVFKQDAERQSFSLEVVMRSAGTSPTEHQVLGNPGQMDGITMKGTVVSFITKYLTAPAAVLSYDMQVHRRLHVVAVHTQEKNSLFVDGELVDEIDLTPEQQADKFAAAGGSLSSGTTTGTGQTAMNAVGIYGYALSGETITRHYLAGISQNTVEEVAYAFGAEIIPLTLDKATTFDQTWDSAEKWNTGQFVDTVIEDDELVPQFAGDVSMAGHWLSNFVFPSDLTSIYGVSVDWDGVGATVELSLDGTTWSAATRGARTTLIPSGFDPTNKVMLVRVSFPGGITDDPSYVKSLKVTGMVNNVLTSASGRTVTMTAASPLKSKPIHELSDWWGMFIPGGTSVTISADTSAEAAPARTIEVWVKIGGGGAVSMTGTGYVNGTPGNVSSGKWALAHVVTAANVTGAITVTGSMNVGHIALYDRALTAAESAAIYAAYVGNNTLRVTDSSVIGISEGPAPVKIYAHDWSIQSAT